MTVREALDQMSTFLGDQGVKPESKKALFLLNRARRLVYPLEDWVHTIKYHCLPITGCCFVLPNDVSAIRAAWSGESVASVVNEYFDSVPRDVAMDLKGERIFFFRTGVNVAFPTQLTGNSKLGFYARDANDEGKNVTITYKNKAGSQITDKIELCGSLDTIYTTEEPVEVMAITKDVTKGEVQVGVVQTRRGYNQEYYKPLYMMAPEFTTGRHEQYKINGQCVCSRVLVKCKLRYRDYTQQDYDTLLDIESIDALEFAAMAITAKQKNELKEYQANIQLARIHLDIDKEDLETSPRGFETMAGTRDHPTDQYECY